MIFNLKKLFIAYVVLLTLFLISVFLVCLIPSSMLRQNVGRTLSTFKKEGTYPSYGLPIRSIVLDNFTDSVMINTAYSVDSARPLWSAMTNTRYVDSYSQVNQITNLEKLYNHTAKYQAGYERYWHGYLVFIRPLLIFFSYEVIRNILTFFLYFLASIFFYLSWKKLGKKTTLAILLGFIFVDFIYLGRSIQFTSVFLIALITSIKLLTSYKKRKSLFVLFFVTGAITSFFDLLTAPLITLGVLLVVATCSDKKQNIFLNCLSWTAGYLSLWISKWIIVQQLFMPGAISNSINEIIFRTVTKADPAFSHLNAIKLNIFQLIGYNRVDKIAILLFALICFFILIKYFSFHKNKVKKIVPWIIIGVIPYLWYFVAANHSYIHVWFTYRDQLMSIISFFIIFEEFINWSKLKSDLQIIRKRFIYLTYPKGLP